MHPAINNYNALMASMRLEYQNLELYFKTLTKFRYSSFTERYILHNGSILSSHHRTKPTHSVIWVNSFFPLKVAALEKQTLATF